MVYSYIWMLIFFAGFSDGLDKATQCVSRGRFPNNERPDCRGYTTCLSGVNGTFTQYDLTCPPNFVYSHIDSQCTNVTTYRCYPEVNCTEIGSFPNPLIDNCTTYIACVEGLSYVVTARLIECPQATVFSPLKRMCVSKTENECVTILERRKILPVEEGHINSYPINRANLHVPKVLTLIMLITALENIYIFL